MVTLKEYVLSHDDQVQELIGRTTDFEIPIKCLILPGLLHKHMSNVEEAEGTWDMVLLHVSIHETD